MKTLHKAHAAIAASLCIGLILVTVAAALAGPVACSADLAAFCAGQQMGSPTAWRCLRAHRDVVSRECRSVLNARRAALMERIRAACSSEIGNFCGNPGRGDPEPLRCLRRYQSQLSDACKAALPRQAS